MKKWLKTNLGTYINVDYIVSVYNELGNSKASIVRTADGKTYVVDMNIDELMEGLAK